MKQSRRESTQTLYSCIKSPARATISVCRGVNVCSDFDRFCIFLAFCSGSAVLKGASVGGF